MGCGRLKCVKELRAVVSREALWAPILCCCIAHRATHRTISTCQVSHHWYRISNVGSSRACLLAVPFRSKGLKCVTLAIHSLDMQLCDDDTMSMHGFTNRMLKGGKVLPRSQRLSLQLGWPV